MWGQLIIENMIVSLYTTVLSKTHPLLSMQKWLEMVENVTFPDICLQQWVCFRRDCVALVDWINPFGKKKCALFNCVNWMASTCFSTSLQQITFHKKIRKVLSMATFNMVLPLQLEYTIIKTAVTDEGQFWWQSLMLVCLHPCWWQSLMVPFWCMSLMVPFWWQTSDGAILGVYMSLMPFWWQVTDGAI